MTKKETKLEPQLTVNEISNKLKLSDNDRKYIEYKYSNCAHEYSKWVYFLKKDGLTINV
jgi:hypothetical protein